MAKLPQMINHDTEDAIIMRASDGLTNNDKILRQKAKVLVEKAKEADSEKIKKGYRWLKKLKTSKLVHPDNIKSHLADGWEKVNPKKTKTI